MFELEQTRASESLLFRFEPAEKKSGGEWKACVERATLSRAFSQDSDQPKKGCVILSLPHPFSALHHIITPSHPFSCPITLRQYWAQVEMDDLLDLSWQPSSQDAVKSNKSASNTTSSMPSFSSSTSSAKPNYYGSSSYVVSPSSSAKTPASLAKATTTNGSASDDAFSSLFASTTAKQQANLSLAERQKLAQNKAQEDKRRNDALWSGLEGSAFGGRKMSSANQAPLEAAAAAAPQRSTQGPPLIAQRLESPASASRSSFGASSRPAAKSIPPSTQPSDPWDFDAFSSSVPSKPAPPLATKSASHSKPNDPFDFDSFDAPLTSAAPTVAISPAINDHDDDNDDILGALAMPVSNQQTLSAQDTHLAAASSSASTASSSADSSRVPSPASGSRPTRGGKAPPLARTGSPPPHVIGQIVEMGFSPAQAKQALAQTDTGANVQAALDLLVGNHESSQDERIARKLQARESGDAFRDSDDDQDAAVHRRQAPPGASIAGRRTRPSPASALDPAAAEANSDWQQQADQLYAQASEIGTSVFNKASAFWSSAKAQAQKALDERNRAAGERSDTPSDAGSERHRNRRWGAASAATAGKSKEWEGKPKWMVDAEQQENHDSSSAGASADTSMQAGGFKDSDNEEDERPQEAVKRAVPSKPAAAAAAAVSSAATALFGSSKSDDIPAAVSRTQSPSGPVQKAPYASRNRHALPSRSAASPAPPKPVLKRRPIPSDASHTISSANRNKEEGNAHFQRGAYGDAESSYTKGISALESSNENSVRLVPLLSNRANVRMKNGDASGTIADCDRLVGIILSLFGGSERDTNTQRVSVYRASQEAPLPADLGDVNLRETFGKALVRRAQALEAGEKWKFAKADWEVLLEYEKMEGSGVKTGGNNMKFAREGLARCSKMLGERVIAAPTASTTPRFTASREEKASTAFAAQQKTLAAEESAKFALKDTIDAKILAWKAGKESNLRALLSSLDTIVWPELGWKKIQLHEVLDDKGLKKNYTKAIARLHPDKVRKDATTEQKMIAEGAFGALNDAWNAQQGQ